MTFAEVVEEQWSRYPEHQRNRGNLLIHAIGVPLVWWCAVQAFGGLFLLLLGVPGGFRMLVWAMALAAASVFAQTRGDALESDPRGRPRDSGDAARGIAAEQFVNFPRFLLGGRWLKNFVNAGQGG